MPPDCHASANGKDRESNHLCRLPPELLLEIANILAPSAVACFALVNRRLFALLKDTLPMGHLKSPQEQPPNIRGSSQFSKMTPKRYQPHRWELLCLLEKDLGQKSLVCSMCLILHPRKSFVKSQVSKEPRWRTCRHGGLRHRPAGIVDLCPCKKLIPSQAHRIREHLQATQKQAVYSLSQWKKHLHICIEGLETAGGMHSKIGNAQWWHACRKSYTGTDLSIYINVYQLKNKALGIFTGYSITSATGFPWRCPRLICAHRSLDCVLFRIHDCAARHPGNPECNNCKVAACCLTCSLVLIGPMEGYLSNGEYNTRLYTRRIISQRDWCKEIVFPMVKYRPCLVVENRV